MKPTSGILLLMILLLVGEMKVVTGIKWWQLSEEYSYEQFCKEHQREYEWERKELFERELRRVLAHNRGSSSWKEGINRFSDRTEAEKRQVLGGDNTAIHYFMHQQSQQSQQATTGGGGRSNHNKNTNHKSWMPNATTGIDWRTQAGILTGIKDQGNCGSCWTFATSSALESYWALAGYGLPVLSEQQILDCTPNPQQCGGSGGCGGGTAPLALEQLQQMGGQATQWTYPYTSYFVPEDPQLNSTVKRCRFNSRLTPPLVTVAGYQLLPSNEPGPLLAALLGGPVIVNVDATAWHGYEEGVFNGCNQQNPYVNHVVVVVGFDQDSWIVRNSYGSDWGDKGYIRLARDPNSQPCGTDTSPQAGIGCLNGPSSAVVCGTCGITYSAIVPIVGLPLNV